MIKNPWKRYSLKFSIEGMSWAGRDMSPFCSSAFARLSTVSVRCERGLMCFYVTGSDDNGVLDERVEPASAENRYR